MGRIKLIVPLFFIAGLFFAESYPPEGWVEDIREALTQAEQENKNILLNFTGSDWCGWCHKLDEEVFSRESFKDYAEKNLVLVFVDAPRSFELPEDQLIHNQVLQSMLGVQGFPTIWLLGADLTPLLRTGYQQGGAQAYVDHLDNDRPFNITAEQIDDFKSGFKEGIETYIGKL